MALQSCSKMKQRGQACESLEKASIGFNSFFGRRWNLGWDNSLLRRSVPRGDSGFEPGCYPQERGSGTSALRMWSWENFTVLFVVVIHWLSRVQLSVTPWTAERQASLSFTISGSLLKLMSIESVMPYNQLVLCHPLLLLPSIFPSIRVFSKESVLYIRWPEYWSFTSSISHSNEYSGLISFRTDWFDLLGVQGTLKSLLQHHSSKASILDLRDINYTILKEDNKYIEPFA